VNIMTRILYVVSVLALCFAFVGLASAVILFEDDFEDQALGDEPQGWEYDPAAEVNTAGQVAEDPLDPDNKVFTDFGGYSAGDGMQLTDFVAEWDWMFFQDNSLNNSMGFRVVDAGNHYQLSRRGGGVDWKIYMFNGAWNEIATNAFPTEIDTWYRVQLTAKGDLFTVKVKEKEDDTPFADLDPVLEVNDGTYGEGAFQTSYYGPIDNVIIADSEQDILAVDPSISCIRTWGDIKKGWI
jgi:hypothetical protein